MTAYEEFRMVRLPAFMRALRKQGKGYEAIAADAGMRHTTVRAVELGSEKTHFPNPQMLTLRRLAKGLELDMHEMAHLSFDLPDPQELGELDETTKVFLEKFRQLNALGVVHSSSTRIDAEEGGNVIGECRHVRP